MNKTHYLRLAPIPFALIKSTQKTVEVRLFDERRRSIKIGDLLEFTNNETKEILITKVIEIQQFSTFAALFAHVDRAKLGYLNNENANPADMYTYYTRESEQKYGVLAIYIELMNDNDVTMAIKVDTFFKAS